MGYDEFNAFCGGLPGTSYVCQWGGAHVWKVGGKVFAIGGWNERGVGITFKVGDVSYALLKDRPGLRPAPYMASRGLRWIQHYAAPGLGDEALRDYLRLAHELVAQKLPRATRISLGLD